MAIKVLTFNSILDLYIHDMVLRERRDTQVFQFYFRSFMYDKDTIDLIESIITFNSILDLS